MCSGHFVVLLLVAQTAVLSQAQSELSRDPCVNFQCQNGGSCTAPADAPYCVCSSPYTGQYCEEVIVSCDPCLNFQCQNGGTCRAPADAPYCECSSPYTGQYCEEVIVSRNPCLRFTCENGGVCTSPLDVPYCECPSGFGGDHCETQVKPGRCPAKEQSSDMGICAMMCSNDYDCQDAQKCCSTPCGGTTCTTEITFDPCDGFCLNGGNCSAPADAPLCECAAGFSGEKCETSDDSSHLGSCPDIEPGGLGLCGGVICTVDDNCTRDQKCCPSSCGGNLCTRVGVSRDPCVHFTCANGGVCTSPVDIPYCKCPSGFGGDHCEMKVKAGRCPVKEQSSNMGICAMMCSNDYDCQDAQKCCSTPCGGTTCTTDIIIDSCDGFCLNGGICSLSDDNAPTCKCPDGFSGESCEISDWSGHDGVCPIVESGGFGVCGGVICTVDDNCTSDHKCCPSACGGNLCTNVDDGSETTSPPLTCSSMLCAMGSFCRSVVSCTTCQSEGRCIHTEYIGEGIDSACQQQNYSEVILMEDASNSSSYHQLKCGGSLDTQTCPSGSVCVDDQRGGGSCCRGQTGQVTSSEKPGACPSSNFSVCGGTMCKVDADCPGAQKCCSGCGNMCTNPVKDELCGNSKCPSGETCVQKQRRCAPGLMCIEALVPTCVPDECSKCEYNEDCNQTSSGYDCIPHQPLDQCGGCSEGQVCIDTGIRCVKAPCPTFQCVPLDECGGCPSDQVCIDTGIRCVKAPCPTFQCVPRNDCGGCPSDQVCIDTGVRCVKAPCPTFQCVPRDECGGCPSGQVCNNTGIVCFTEPCPAYQCIPVDECGGCPSDQVCIDTGIRCVKAPCPTFQCVPRNECGGCPSDQVCIDIGVRCVKAPCPTFQCVPRNECGGCPSDQVCIDTGVRCVKAPCPTFQCVPRDECGGCPRGQVCKGTGIICKTTPCPSFECVPECPLRCPANYACEFTTNECSGNKGISCFPTLVSKCVRVKPELGSCPQVPRRLRTLSFYCLLERLFFKCQSDRNCIRNNQKCCTSVCGNNVCTAVKKRLVGDD